ncbi:MAG: ribonuclease Y [Ignavibacteriales bacterium]|nr:MAG: ribonuclease Y [Ignavibacteriales bacterium]
MELLDLTYILLLLVLAFWLGWKLNSRLGKRSVAAGELRAAEIIDSAKRESEKMVTDAKKEYDKILTDAEKESQNLKREKLLEVKDEWYKKKVEYDSEVNQKRQKLQNLEKQVQQREETIDRKLDTVSAKERENKEAEKNLLELKKNLDLRAKELDRIEKEQNEKLEKISGLTAEEAKAILIENMTQEAKGEVNKAVKGIYEKAKLEAKKESQKVIIQAIQRTAAEVSVETTVSVIQIHNDELKGRIIGKEGRNIRAFEAATGVDVIVDDTPEAVILSSYDQFRREVARLSLERLMADGRIHPARIEEVVAKVEHDLEEEMFKEGETVVLQLGIHGVHNELIKLIGRMKYRSSYGQNLLQHSVEVAYLTGIMAAEIGLDANMAKRAGLLHDIGKTMDRIMEGPHALIGMEITKKFREHPIIVNAVGSHHEDIEMEHPIAPLVQAADAISGARPGARREPIEGYVKRLETLEAIARSFEGVAKTYAIQAGREVRVVVEHDKVDDIVADKLAYDIARKIEDEMQFPGQIKVTVIREVRKVHFAK